MYTSSHLKLHICFLFFFHDTATTEIYTLSLHDALPICSASYRPEEACRRQCCLPASSCLQVRRARDRKSTRLNSSHTVISYAVFCLKKKKRNSAKNGKGEWWSHCRLGCTVLRSDQ